MRYYDEQEQVSLCEALDRLLTQLLWTESP
jgi:hypothetical protein